MNKVGTTDYRKYFLLLLAFALWLVVAKATAGEVSPVSRPVGFIRLEVPADDTLLVSTPFKPFDPALNSVLADQLTGSSDISQADHIYKWDGFFLSYTEAAKADGQWWADYDEKQLTDIEIKPGEAYLIDNRQPTHQRLYFVGEVVLLPQSEVLLSTPVSTFGYPYSTRTDLSDTPLWGLADSRVLDDGLNEVTNNLIPGRGYWFVSSNSAAVAWTEACPYDELFPGSNSLPRISAMRINRDGTAVTLNIDVTGKKGEALDIFYQDLSLTNELDTTGGWKLADGRVRTKRQRSIKWTDYGNGKRAPVSEVYGRYYLVGRSDLDTDGDGVSDARELFCNQTDPFSAPHVFGMRAESQRAEYRSQGGTNRVATLSRGKRIGNRRHKLVGRMIYVDCKKGADSLTGRLSVVIDPDGPKKSIRAGLAAADDGDTIIIKEGRYDEKVRVAGRNLKIRVQGRVDLRQEKSTARKPVIMATQFDMGKTNALFSTGKGQRRFGKK